MTVGVVVAVASCNSGSNSRCREGNGSVRAQRRRKVSRMTFRHGRSTSKRILIIVLASEPVHSCSSAPGTSHRDSQILVQLLSLFPSEEEQSETDGDSRCNETDDNKRSGDGSSVGEEGTAPSIVAIE